MVVGFDLGLARTPVTVRAVSVAARPAYRKGSRKNLYKYAIPPATGQTVSM